MKSTSLAKIEIREEMLRRRQALIADTRRKANAIIFDKMTQHERYRLARTIHIYVSFQNEVDTHRIIQHALDSGKHVIVPKVIKKPISLTHYFLDNIDNLSRNRFGVLEPIAAQSEPCLNPTPDLIVVPGLAFDHSGNRIGFGKGYYDRFLAETKGYKIALAYDFQILPHIPSEEFDIQMDEIVTEIVD